MSLKSWEKEFYPVDAKTVAEISNLAMFQHTLLKYKGARKENLKKHRVKIINCRIFSERRSAYGYPFKFTDSTCSLCFAYHNIGYCTSCPIHKAGQDCNTVDNCPYQKFLDGDPEPMIELMLKLIKKEKIKNAKAKARKKVS